MCLCMRYVYMVWYNDYVYVVWLYKNECWVYLVSAEYDSAIHGRFLDIINLIVIFHKGCKITLRRLVLHLVLFEITVIANFCGI